MVHCSIAQKSLVQFYFHHLYSLLGNRDYESTRTSLNFDPSSDRECVNIVTHTDSMQEVEEIFGVAIQSPVEDVRLFRANATINITDTTPGTCTTNLLI